ncbi:MAG: GNAT family N-acetyltransferase [Pseudomonadota bacterium]
MPSLTPDAYLAAIDVTWAPGRLVQAGQWCVRAGACGGQRVSAATAMAPLASLCDMIEAQHALGQPPLVMVRDGEGDLDARLHQAGFRLNDPVRVLSVDPAAWPRAPQDAYQTTRTDSPLAIQAEIWAEDGIGPARLAVMDRVQAPKTYLLGRHGDVPVGVGFVALDGPLAMLHGFYVRAEARGQGVGSRMLREAADWARAQGAQALSVLVREATPGALALYTKRGMEEVTRYHYRVLDTRSET